jgi:hypothetical protein
MMFGIPPAQHHMQTKLTNSIQKFGGNNQPLSQNGLTSKTVAPFEEITPKKLNFKAAPQASQQTEENAIVQEEAKKEEAPQKV